MSSSKIHPKAEDVTTVDPQKCTIEGPGIDPENMNGDSGNERRLEVTAYGTDGKSFGGANFKAAIVGEDGKEEVLDYDQDGPASFVVTWAKWKQAGKFWIRVWVDGHLLPSELSFLVTEAAKLEAEQQEHQQKQGQSQRGATGHGSLIMPSDNNHCMTQPLLQESKTDGQLQAENKQLREENQQLKKENTDLAMKLQMSGLKVVREGMVEKRRDQMLKGTTWKSFFLRLFENGDIRYYAENDIYKQEGHFSIIGGEYLAPLPGELTFGINAKQDAHGLVERVYVFRCQDEKLLDEWKRAIMETVAAVQKSREEALAQGLIPESHSLLAHNNPADDIDAPRPSGVTMQY